MSPLRAAALVPLLLLMAGCAAPAPPAPAARAWTVFDSADDGCECAEVVATTHDDEFNASYQGMGYIGGLMGYYEDDVPLGVPLRLEFEAPPNGSVQARVELRYGFPPPEVRCDEGNASRLPSDPRFEARVEGARHRCAITLTLHEPVEEGNGIRLVWRAYARGAANADGGVPAAPLAFRAQR